MGSDFYFRMGATHSICQDYALAGVLDGIEYAVLSDGCSGTPVSGDPGSPYTDFGARFLVRAAQHNLRAIADGLFPDGMILAEAAAIARQAALPRQCLDATLLVATRGDRYSRVEQMGDGVVGTRSKDGKLHYRTLKYGNNMPHYLSYRMDWERQERYFDEAKTVTVTYGTFTPGEGWTSHSHEEDIREFFRDKLTRTTIVDNAEEDLVLIMSDGAESFQKKSNGEPVPLEDVMEQLFAIKNFTGEFLVRRCNAFLKRFCAEHDWQHTDDLSVTGLYLGDPP